MIAFIWKNDKIIKYKIEKNDKIIKYKIEEIKWQNNKILYFFYVNLKIKDYQIKAITLGANSWNTLQIFNDFLPIFNDILSSKTLVSFEEIVFSWIIAVAW